MHKIIKLWLDRICSPLSQLKKLLQYYMHNSHLLDNLKTSVHKHFWAHVYASYVVNTVYTVSKVPSNLHTQSTFHKANIDIMLFCLKQQCMKIRHLAISRKMYFQYI